MSSPELDGEIDEPGEGEETQDAQLYKPTPLEFTQKGLARESLYYLFGSIGAAVIGLFLLVLGLLIGEVCGCRPLWALAGLGLLGLGLLGTIWFGIDTLRVAARGGPGVQRPSDLPDVETLKSQSDVEGLIEALGSTDKDVRRAAADALDTLGWQPDEDDLKAACWMARGDWDRCVELGAPAITPLTIALHDADERTRWAAAEALRAIGAPAVQPLMALLKINDDDVRWAAAVTLGKIGDPAVRPLIAAVQDRDAFVRRAAAHALGNMGDARTRAIEPLIASCRTRDGDVRDAAAYALGQIGEPAVEPLIAALKDYDSRARACAAVALGHIGDARAIEPLTAACKDESMFVRSSANDALVKIKAKQSTE